MLERNFLFTWMALGIHSLLGQTTALTFTALYEDEHRALDSILVMNVTQGSDTMLYGQDTVLVLDLSTALDDDMIGRDRRITGYPNPFTDRCIFSIALPSAEKVRVLVTDMAGTHLLSWDQELAAGVHRFAYGNGVAGARIVSVGTATQQQSFSAMALGSNGAEEHIQYLGQAGPAPEHARKDGRSLFSWAPGDVLRSIGYVTLAGDIVGSGAFEGGVSASDVVTFTTRKGRYCTASPWVTDVDGNAYDVVSIAGHCWMAADLRTSRYANGDVIPNVETDEDWIATGTGAWCHYENNSAYDAVYGKLYTAYTVLDPRGVCPSGWHVGTTDDWNSLEIAAGVPLGQVNNSGWIGIEQNAAAAITAESDAWSSVPPCATDALGFRGVPGGFRSFTFGEFAGIGEDAFWWHYAGWGAISVDGCGIYWDSNSSANATSGMSIRCVRD